MEQVRSHRDLVCVGGGVPWGGGGGGVSANREPGS